MSDKKQLKQRIIDLVEQQEVFDQDNPDQMEVFLGSLDRFTDIALLFEGRERLLDVGSGGGILPAVLATLGHECHALDIRDESADFTATYERQGVNYSHCNVEVDPFPYPDNHFDAVSCCQVLEHFTHSHLPAMGEMLRVLKPGGVLEIDVPNVASFRNRSRMLRGKNITYDYQKHYLDERPISYKGMSFYPLRHNREFTKAELELLFRRAGFERVRVWFLKSRRHRSGLQRIKSAGSALRDAVPSLRKSLMGVGYKPD